MQPSDKVLKSQTKKQIFLNNFLGGVSWGIGSALGALLLVTVLGFILAKVNFVPMIASFVSDVNQLAQQKQNN